MKYRDLVKRVEADGWVLERQEGSHLQFRHSTKRGTVTISAGGRMSRDVPPVTLSSVLKQAGLKR